jgi:L-asparaginase/Glu-tRNA(Gln) amidotransferase subunit D
VRMRRPLANLTAQQMEHPDRSVGKRSDKSKIKGLVIFHNTQFIKRCAAMLIMRIIIYKIPFATYRVVMNVI